MTQIMKVLRQGVWALLLLGSVARADIAIEIVGAGSQQYPIAIAPFQNEVNLPQSLTAVISNDLTLSGLFRIIPAGDLAPVPYQPAEVNAQAMVGRGAQTVLVGQVAADNGGYRVRFWLLEAASRRELLALEVKTQAKQLRRTAHQIADMIYEKITGERGAFNSRIAYVLKQGGRNELQVADSDGFGAQTILASREPILSPKWSPDGSTLAYVSFEKQKPVVFTHHLQSGRRVPVASFRGNNSAPAWSPDGSQLAVALTKDGGTNVYVINAQGGSARRLSFGGEINTEPSWTPDGQHILFTSDRGGSPQIYRQAVTGNGAERMTFTGSYNASAKMSPDGRMMTFITRDNGAYRVAIMDVATRQVMVLTDSPDDDSPSFSPNGRMILHESVVDRKRSLAVVSSDGRVKQRLRALAGEVRQPAWGPLLK